MCAYGLEQKLINMSNGTISHQYYNLKKKNHYSLIKIIYLARA